MKTIQFFPGLLVMLFSGISFAQTADPPEKTSCIPCEEIINLRLPDVTISQAELIQEPVPHCKVSGIIGSEINFELLLPEQWNSRFAMGGGGGFVGSVQNMAESSIGKGYATAGTDTGHKGIVIKADWALNHMERQVNFGHLAIHRTAVTSKAIIEQYYCSPITYSYFLGCSRGGGQAMMEAQRYPGDFDGIVAGAPAFKWPANSAKKIQNAQAIYPNPDDLGHPVITPANLELLQSLVLEQCDAMDGLRDRIINDPGDCDLDEIAFPLCADDTPADDCFTSDQLDAIKTVYADLILDNHEVSPGFPPGCENEPGGWKTWITGPNAGLLMLGFPSLQFGFGTETFKYLFFQDPEWDYSTYDFSDFSATTEYASSYLDAASTDYSAFNEHGGKMIIYHGWNDPALSAYATINHYKQVKSGDPDVENYLRLFLLPGVLHCGGGPGPDQADWLALIREWVEEGAAPERVIVSKMEADSVIMTRPVFPYPEKAIWDGKGDPNSEESFRSTINRE